MLEDNKDDSDDLKVPSGCTWSNLGTISQDQAKQVCQLYGFDMTLNQKLTRLTDY